MDYITIKEASEKRDVNTWAITYHIKEAALMALNGINAIEPFAVDREKYMEVCFGSSEWISSADWLDSPCIQVCLIDDEYEIDISEARIYFLCEGETAPPYEAIVDHLTKWSEWKLKYIRYKENPGGAMNPDGEPLPNSPPHLYPEGFTEHLP